MLRAERRIAYLLTKRVHFAAFVRLGLSDQESRNSNAARDYWRLSIGIPKIAFGARIPVLNSSVNAQALTVFRRSENIPVPWKPDDDSNPVACALS